MRITLRATLLAFAVLALAALPSCGGDSNKTDEGMKDAVTEVTPSDLPDVMPEMLEEIRDVPPSEDVTVEDPGTADEGTVQPDQGGEDVTEELPQCTMAGAPWCPCNDSSDCISPPLCVPTMNESICALPCGTDVACPNGWTCEQSSVGEQIFACYFKFPNLCRPCQKDQDCVPAGGAGDRRFLCIDSGPTGKFCGAECTQSSDCPTYEGQTFECVPVTTATGEVKQCRPTNGICPCTDKFQDQGYETICYVENEFGRCTAPRTCDQSCDAKTPLVESCNGQDDDCDGRTDEDLAAIPCDLTNPAFPGRTCPGQADCVNGRPGTCQGTPPSADSVEYGLFACDGVDNDCDGITDKGFPDQDSDKIADCVDPDVDGDGVANELDNCPTVSNADQVNNDAAEELAGQKKGDACDDDDDNDGVPDSTDNCALVKNGDQLDANGNQVGDACDCDADSDGIPNVANLDMQGNKCPVPTVPDNCPVVSNTDQLDTNGNGQGDACDCDIDSDTVKNNNPGCPAVDTPDNCRTVPNLDQLDKDLDRIGDACDCDIDNDEVMNNNPTCPVITTVDNCIDVYNPVDVQTGVQADTDLDLIGDACDCDVDADGVFNPNPNCPACAPCDNCVYTPNPGQEVDKPGDEYGLACNTDWDKDGVPNDDDNCPRTPNTEQGDLDFDRIGDACDCDADGDGIGNDGVDKEGASCPVPPTVDNCARIANIDQSDQDLDNIGDACDCDIDGDGDPQPNFECPTPTLPDCEPFDPAISHLAVEKCNGINDDCDDQTDEENATGCTTFFFDKDNDGYGTALSKCLCAATDNYRALSSNDCNDDEPTVNPGVQEICDNSRDDNCNGSENDLNALDCTKFYWDSDNDGYGTAEFECRCTAAGNKYKAFQTGDCDDGNPLVNPGKTEVCNDGMDNNCNGTQNDENAGNCKWFYYDGDSDTYGTALSKCFCFANTDLKFTATRSCDGLGHCECNDADASVNPGMDEVCNNGKDDNCDGFQDLEGSQGCLTYYFDGDKDKFGLTSDSKCLCNTMGSYTTRDGGDCQDANPNINPSVTESCDGIDNNCDSRIDENPTQLCAPLPNATSVCSAGQCIIGECLGTNYNVNGIVSDGCECGQDANDNTANTCATAIFLGEAWDNGSALPLVTGRVVPGTDEDWYYVVAKDSTDSGNFSTLGSDKFNVVATLKAPLDGTIKVDVRKGGCSVGQTCGGVTYQWKATNETACISPPDGTAGQFWSCCAPGQCDGGATSEQNACCNNVTQCSDSHDRRHCLDDGATFYIRVYHDPSMPQATKCADTEYALEVSNGK